MHLIISILEKSASSTQEMDLLFKDLNKKTQSFRQNMVSLATELKQVRSRLAL